MNQKPPETDFDIPAPSKEFGTVIDLLPKGELDTLAADAGTDKRSEKHDYMRFYEAILAPYRDQEFTFLELGVGIPSRKAPSLRTWKAFFPKATIVGFDIKPVSKTFEEDRIHVEIGDAARPRRLRRVFNKWKPSVVLDDASHFWSHQIVGFKTMFPMLPPNGVYIVEDIHTSFGHRPETSKYADADESFWSLMARLQFALAGDQRAIDLNPAERRLVNWIDAIYLTRKTVAIVKRSTPAKGR